MCRLRRNKITKAYNSIWDAVHGQANVLKALAEDYIDIVVPLCEEIHFSVPDHTNNKLVYALEGRILDGVYHICALVQADRNPQRVQQAVDSAYALLVQRNSIIAG